MNDISTYKTWTDPFNTTIKPDLNWDSQKLTWSNGPGSYMLGQTVSTGRSSTITLNQNMLENSSQLLIASTAIHETIHAVINYNIVSAGPDYRDANTQSWLYGINVWYTLNGLPSNFADHYEMLDYYFDQAVAILAQWDGNKRDYKDYQKTFFYGLNQYSIDNRKLTDKEIEQKTILDNEYQHLLNKYSFTQSELNDFYSSQLNVSSSERLPTSGCN